MLNQLNVKARTEYLARIRNTPKGLWTRAQMSDLGLLGPELASKAPHHPGHSDHGHGGDHGHAGGHGSDEHGDHDDHDAHSKEEAAH